MRNICKLGVLRPMFCCTPLLEIDFTYKGKPKKMFAKYESYNFSGSVKDRIAFHIFYHSYLNNLLGTGQKIVEVTSGNTGISFAALARAMGHEIRIIMPDWLSQERYAIMELYGAEIEKVSKEEGGFLGSIERAKKYAKETGAFYPDQFSNKFNTLAHEETTGPEIIQQLERLNLKPDIFVAGVGTGGTIMGVKKCFEKLSPHTKCHPLEPSNSPTMSTGGKKIGNHRIQGISDEFIPAIVDLEYLDDIVAVDDGDSIILAKKLNEKGLSVGISSGANFLGVLKEQLKNGEDKVGVTIFSDSSFKYLTTDLCKKEPVKDEFLSNDIEIISFKAHNIENCGVINCPKANEILNKK